MSRILHHPLVRNIAKVGAGNVLGNGMNFLAMYLVADILGKVTFGVFVSLQATMLLMAQLADGGMTTSIIKSYRELDDANRPAAAEALLRQTLWVRMAIVALLGVLAWALARPLNDYWLEADGGEALIRWIALGAIGSSCWMFVQSAMQSRQQFTRYAWMTFGNHALRLALFVALIFADTMTLPNTIYVFVAIPFIGSLLGGMMFPRGFWISRMPAGETADEFRAMLRLSRWIFLSFMVVSLLSRMDILMLTKLSTKAETGTYGFANLVAMAYPIIGASISTVLLPKISVTRRRGDMLRMWHGLIRFAPVACLATAGLLVAGHLLIPLVNQGEYRESALVLDLLAIGLTLAVIINPLSFFCLTFERAQWLTWMNLAQLGINLVLNWLLIPKYGALAAAGATLTTQIFGFLFVTGAFWWLLKQARED